MHYATLHISTPLNLFIFILVFWNIHTVCSQESALHVLFVQFRVLFVVLYVKPCQRRFSVLGWTKFSESESLIFYQYYCINSTMCLLQQISHCIFKAHSLPFMLKPGYRSTVGHVKVATSVFIWSKITEQQREREAVSHGDQSYYAWKNSSLQVLPSWNISMKKDFDTNVLLTDVVTHFSRTFCNVY